jgi:hypothetical protein
VKKLMAVVLIGGSWMLCGATAHAQTTPPKENTTHAISDQDLNMLRKDLRSKKKTINRCELETDRHGSGKVLASIRPVREGADRDQ